MNSAPAPAAPREERRRGGKVPHYLLNRERPSDRLFRWGLMGFALTDIALIAGLGWVLSAQSGRAWSAFGASFLWDRAWDPVAEKFGALPFIYGTLASSLLALALAVPLGLGTALFLTELAPKRLASAMSFVVELLAAVPSVILGLMGIFLLVPCVKAVQPGLQAWLGWLPFFRGEPYGVSLLAAGLILAIMVVPYITVISREVLLTVPQPLKEGLLALGATPWEAVRLVSLPFARPGIMGAVFLGLGRALGETMAVTMVIGNTPKISLSLLDPSYTMAAVIANELAEAAGDLHLAALMGIGLVLMGLTLAVNAAARLLVYQVSRGRE